VKRVIIVGPGAADKSTLAARLGEITGLPVIELDKLFWRPGLAATPPGQWAATQRQLAARESWIMDGGSLGCTVTDHQVVGGSVLVITCWLCGGSVRADGLAHRGSMSRPPCR